MKTLVRFANRRFTSMRNGHRPAGGWAHVTGRRHPSPRVSTLVHDQQALATSDFLHGDERSSAGVTLAICHHVVGRAAAECSFKAAEKQAGRAA